MILLIDNYDSFTYNLAHLFGELGAEELRAHLPGHRSAHKIRSIFIALSENKRLRAFAERSKIGRRVSSRFVAGMTVDDALVATAAMNRLGMSVSIDNLGENVTNTKEARESAALYHELLDAIERAEEPQPVFHDVAADVEAEVVAFESRLRARGGEALSVKRSIALTSPRDLMASHAPAEAHHR